MDNMTKKVEPCPFCKNTGIAEYFDLRLLREGESIVLNDSDEMYRELKQTDICPECKSKPCSSWKECINKEPRHCALNGCLKLN